MTDYRRFMWRTGRRKVRTMYAQLDPTAASDEDPMIGVMDTPELSTDAVQAHNERLGKDRPC